MCADQAHDLSTHPTVRGASRTPIPAARFYLSEFHVGAATVQLLLESPTWAMPRVVMYDVAGRKIRTLAEGAPVIGTREYVWDRRDAAGSVVGSGIYFVRLTGIGKPTALRVPLVR